MEVPEATVVDGPVKRIQIPQNLRPGDSFIYTDNQGSFTVIVPEDAAPGSFINVIVPSETEIVDDRGNARNTSGKIVLDKATAGAIVVGAVVGGVLLGVVGGVALAGGAAYLASKKHTKAGKITRNIGEKSYNETSKVAKWVAKQF